MERGLIHLLLVPAILLANVLCVCAHAKPAAAIQAHAVAEHACCSPGEMQAQQTPVKAASGPAQQGHDSDRCPHCLSKNSVAAEAKTVGQDLAVAHAPVFAWLPWPSILAVLTPRKNAVISSTEVSSAPAADLLRVKCALRL